MVVVVVIIVVVVSGPVRLAIVSLPCPSCDRFSLGVYHDRNPERPNNWKPFGRTYNYLGSPIRYQANNKLKQH